MKKQVIVLAIVSLLALVQASQAANLQEGWWVNINGVAIYSYGGPPDHLPYLRGTASFETAPGQYGPFLVSDGSFHDDSLRYVSVPYSTVASPDQSLVLPMYMPDPWSEIAFITVEWGTSYDASQMRLQLWHQPTSGANELIWSQNLSGTHYGGTDLLQDCGAPDS